VWSANFTFKVTVPFVPHFHGLIYVDNTKNIERQASLDTQLVKAPAHASH